MFRFEIHRGSRMIEDKSEKKINKSKVEQSLSPDENDASEDSQLDTPGQCQ